MSSVAVHKDAYRESFERFVGAVRSEPEWLRERRTSAFGRFVEEGLPGPRDEAWRQTPIASINVTVGTSMLLNFPVVTSAPIRIAAK